MSQVASMLKLTNSDTGVVNYVDVDDAYAERVMATQIGDRVTLRSIEYVVVDGWEGSVSLHHRKSGRCYTVEVEADEAEARRYCRRLAA